MGLQSRHGMGHLIVVTDIRVTCEGGETHDHEEAADGRHGGEADCVAGPSHDEGEQLPGDLSAVMLFAQYLLKFC